MDSSKQIAAGITFLVGLIVFLWLILTTLEWSYEEYEARQEFLNLSYDSEEFIEPELLRVPVTSADEASAPALTEKFENNPSQPAPETGTALSSQGKSGDPAKTVVSEQPSPVQKKSEPQPTNPGNPSKTNPDNAKISAAQTKQMTNAFATADAKNQAINKNGDTGLAGNVNGKPDSAGNPKSKSTRPGRGTAVVGGSWKAPAYSRNIQSNEVGSVIFAVKVNADGSVGDIKERGGGGLSKATKDRCRAEIKSKKYIHPNPAKAQPAEATVTFIFEDPKN